MQIFTDDRESLLKAVSRPDDPLSATELADAQPQNVHTKSRPLTRPPLRAAYRFSRRRR